MSILVAYATSHGSTHEIAERIAAQLTKQLAPTAVECRPTADVPRLSTIPGKYKAVVVGSAIHAGSWIGPGHRFMQQNAAFLSGRAPAPKPQKAPVPSVWAFTVGMPNTDDDLKTEAAMVETKLRKEVGSALQGHELFRGVFEKQQLPWPLRLIFQWVVPEDKTKWGDHRDWDAIEAWSLKVGQSIKEKAAKTAAA